MGERADTLDLSDLDQFASKPPVSCGACKLITQLDPEMVAKLEAAMRIPEGAPKYYSNPTIVKWLQAQDFDITTKSIPRHRTGQCQAKFRQTPLSELL